MLLPKKIIWSLSAIVTILAVCNVEAVYQQVTQNYRARSLNQAHNSSKSVLVLVPSGSNLTETQLTDGNFDLFKLNADVLWGGEADEEDEEPETTTQPATVLATDQSEDMDLEERQSGPSLVDRRRRARRMNILKGVWSKPKASPLYLVNGTVCRFVNSSPICTTLATTGLIPTSSGVAAGGGAAAPRPATGGQFQGQGSSVQFANQPMRPAAVLDDDPQDINVESSLNSTSDNANFTRLQQFQQPQQLTQNPSFQQQQSQQNQRPMVVSSPFQARPLNFNRRPLNLMALRRPVRHYQFVGNRAFPRERRLTFVNFTRLN